MRLAGKIAIITGAGAGIGEASAKMFARHGARVACADRNGEAAERAAAEIVRDGGDAVSVCADMSSPDDVQRMFQAVLERFGGLNVLFNNAGTVAQGRVEETSMEEWDQQIATTLTSVFLGCKYGIPVMRSGGGGVIINMSSVAGVMGLVSRAAYSAAKGGVAALTRAIALDHAGEGIRAIYLTPATIETPSLRERINSSPDPAAARKAFEARQPIGRIGSPEDVAYAALYAASDEAAFLTGCAIAVDGGMAV